MRRSTNARVSAHRLSHQAFEPVCYYCLHDKHFESEIRNALQTPKCVKKLVTTENF
jgi:hypothetical protein